MSREEKFLEYYRAQPSNAPDHQRLLSGSDNSGMQRYQQVTSLLRHSWVSSSVEANQVGAVRQKILDFGCGLGVYSFPLAKMGFRIVGIDYFEGFVTSCEAKAKAENIEATFLQGSYQDLAEKVGGKVPEGGFNGVLCVGVLQNIDSELEAIHAFSEVLAEGGWLCIETLNKKSLKNYFSQNPLLKSFAPSDIAQICSKLGIQCQSITPVFILPKPMGFLIPIFQRLSKIPFLKTLLFLFAHGFIYFGYK